MVSPQNSGRLYNGILGFANCENVRAGKRFPFWQRLDIPQPLRKTWCVLQAELENQQAENSCGV
jgi:hypothetical protein